MLRVGMLTSGGDCQGLNAAMRGVARTLFESSEEVEIFAYQDGYKGLMKGQYTKMENRDFSGILTQGGTFIGTSRMPFKDLHLPADPESAFRETRLEAMLRNYKMQKLDCLVMLGGNGSHKTAYALSQAGCNVVTLPKTIDNDLWGTERTFGFQSAINIAAQVIDGIHTTATSHGRIFIVEVMGHKVGWLTLYAGLAGGADIILLPEIPYRREVIKAALRQRQEEKKRFSIIAMAEGAMSYEESLMSKEERLSERAKQLPPSYELAKWLEAELGQEVRVTVPGHFQRGGAPSPYDRVFATLCGSYAAEQILKRNFGIMVGQKKGKMACFELADVAGKLKSVDLDCDALRSAEKLGLCLGDDLEEVRKRRAEKEAAKAERKKAKKKLEEELQEAGAETDKKKNKTVTKSSEKKSAVKKKAAGKAAGTGAPKAAEKGAKETSRNNKKEKKKEKKSLASKDKG